MKPPNSYGNGDPLLDELWGMPSCKCSLYQTIDAFLKKLIYSAESDFPAFGARLLILQNFIIAPSPNNIVTLWYDRRDTRRFCSFWAVIVVRGSSLYSLLFRSSWQVFRYQWAEIDFIGNS